jgi:hypothetical protein
VVASNGYVTVPVSLSVLHGDPGFDEDEAPEASALGPLFDSCGLTGSREGL